ncbi:tyrosine-type recombinase/integrase [Rhodococcus sp. D2-41]|uniref:Tyrosine-type recombinase/integrase n=1 Tax=Speluncibacter jeojiensis TaxID=2710754 RepID=A0A9X4M5K0_9ACTN|nr:tyrosine-type recombinase/integrase [Rhodococcus sp. D2-41]MDG3009375.1 tyrosine-type recombinase/integrase [Rhodococcus sp. D2-41]MDG3017249.1 tyrosine-type recombinase/integrase [Corynebacteriales bacterium D3-21]
MARAQRVSFDDRPDTFLVVGADELPIPAAREYLRFLCANDASPHTVRSYAQGLAQWWTVLEATGDHWDDFPTSLFGMFLIYLRTGDLPGTNRIGQPERRMAESSIQPRAAAVLSMYRYHADAHLLNVPYQRLFTSHGRRYGSRYRGFLDGVGPTRQSDRPIYRSRAATAAHTPILLPTQVNTILDSCSVQGDDGWSGSAAGLRDRLFFAVLAETGMRMGEALSLRHSDVHIGGGATPFVEIAGRDDHPHGARAKSGARRIYIGDDLAALYSEYVWQLVAQGADVAVNDLATHFVFVNLARGTRYGPIRPETVYEKVRSIKRQQPGLVPAGWTPHWLRHTHATALLLAGVREHVVMRRLGHADVQTTLSIYGWVTEDAEMRTLAQWRNFVAGWKGLHDGQP